jgi:hypothetical protein
VAADPNCRRSAARSGEHPVQAAAIPAAHSLRPSARGARAWLWLTVGLTAGAFLAAVLLAPPASASPGRGLAWLLFTGSSAHVAATAWFYTLPQVRAHVRGNRTRYICAPLGLIAGAGVIAAALPPADLEFWLLPFFGWQFFHYQKQNLGLAALAASAQRVRPLRPGERRPLLISGLAGIAGLLARPGLLHLTVRLGMEPLRPAAAVVFAAAVAAGLAAVARRPAAERPAGFCVTYLISLVFSLPIFVFGSPYAAVAGMTIAHGLQYLLLVALVAAGPGDGRGRIAGVLALCNIALIGGALLAAASHLHGSPPALRLLFGAYLGALMAHFVIDAGLWRMRAEFPRAFLTSRVPYLMPGRTPG